MNKKITAYYWYDLGVMHITFATKKEVLDWCKNWNSQENKPFRLDFEEFEYGEIPLPF